MADLRKKKCSKCRKEKPLTDYYRGKSKYGLKAKCKPCHLKESKEYRQNNKEKESLRGKRYLKANPDYYVNYHKNHRKEHKNNNLKKTFGITLDDYNKMFELQKGCCEICGIHQSELKFALGVDHCHDTGRVRKLLCGRCNNGLGCFNDDTNLMKKAIKYLRDN